ncbi:MAG: hypothetical protein LUC83_05755, partial [Clostridiales bacterium]|nr:hypothetical protein [Clostridiales bacterium]
PRSRSGRGSVPPALISREPGKENRARTSRRQGKESAERISRRPGRKSRQRIRRIRPRKVGSSRRSSCLKSAEWM